MQICVNGCIVSQPIHETRIEKITVDKEVSFIVMREDKEPFEYEYTSYQEVSSKCPVKLIVIPGAQHPAPAAVGHVPMAGADGGEDQGALEKFHSAKSGYEKSKKDREYAELEYNKSVINHRNAITDLEKLLTQAQQDAADKNLQLAKLIETASVSSLAAAKEVAKAELLKTLE